MQVVYSEEHRRHDHTTELAAGEPTEFHERPVRADIIRAALAADPSFTEVGAGSWGLGPIEAVHDPDLVAYLSDAWAELARVHGPRAAWFPDTVLHPALRRSMGDGHRPTDPFAQLGWWCFETATPLTEGSYAAARAAIDVALTAAAVVLDGGRYAYGLCRPPGHHSPRDAFGGYCFFNNAAVVAHHIAASTGANVTVLDVDYHHGNGTQQIFYERDDVQFVSLHADPTRAYPYFTGYADEIGAGRGRGHTLNLPLAARLDDDGYLRVLERALDAVDGFRPDVLVVSLGVDTYDGDPISDLALTTEGMGRCGRAVGRLALPTVVLQEGGYAQAALGTNVHTWLTGLARADPGGVGSA